MRQLVAASIKQREHRMVFMTVKQSDATFVGIQKSRRGSHLSILDPKCYSVYAQLMPLVFMS